MTLLPADLRYAARTWRKRPVLIAAAVLTLALGTGANTAIFSVIHSAMLRPLPYPQPDRLVQVWSADVDAHGRLDRAGKGLPGTAAIESWSKLDTAFERIAWYRGWNLSLTAGGLPERLRAAMVSPDFFATLGIATARGRGFTEEENTAGHDDVVILSDRLWRSRFQSDPSAIGRTVLVDSEPRTVIGIMPAGSRIHVASLWEDPDLFAPISTISRGVLRRAFANVVGRLKPGITVAAAGAEIDSLARKLPSESARHGAPPQGIRLVPLGEEVASGIRPMLLILFAATGCVLLIACANLANLTLAHIAARQKELVIRTALGAPRARLVRQVLTESVALSIAGGALGLLLSGWLVKALVGLYPGSLPRLESLDPSPMVFLFSLALTLVTGLLAGIFPAWRFSRADFHEGLKGGGSFSHRSRSGSAFRAAMVAAQVAATFVLLISTGLLLRSFLLLRAVDPGVRPQRLLTAQVVLPKKLYDKKELQIAFADRFVERIGALPGVESAAITNSLPMAYNFLLSVDFTLDPATPEKNVFCRAITPAYFRTMGIPLLAGRPFEPADAARGGVTIVNRAFARKYFPDRDPVGRSLRFGPVTSATIVGIAADVKNRALDAKADEEIYLPFAQMPNLFLDLAIRATSDPAPLVNRVRAELRSIDPNQPLSRVLTMEKILDDEVAPRRFQAALLGTLAALALLLAIVGIYGVVAYSVGLRTREIGIRMALGAQRPEVLRLVLRRGMMPVLMGVAAGIPASLAATRALESWLYGVHAIDAVTYVGVAVLMLAVPLLASYLPARRATTIDPLVALRYE
jgi:putative ABC transport system permease protein